jgi:hypothetical protein
MCVVIAGLGKGTDDACSVDAVVLGKSTCGRSAYQV